MATIALIPNSIVSDGGATSVVVNQITTVMDSMKDIVDAHIGKLDDTIASLLESATEDTEFVAPEIDYVIEAAPIEAPEVEAVDYSAMQAIDAEIPAPIEAAPDIPEAPTLPTLAEPLFDVVSMPSAPSIQSFAVPSRPSVDLAPTIPEQPTLVRPDLPTLIEVDIPTFTAIELPTFDETAPTLDSTEPLSSLNWSEPAYVSETMEAILATLQDMREGTTGLPAEIEAQLFDRARAREDRTAHRAEQEIYEAFAGRGFVAPPGMMSKQLAQVREATRMQANSLERDIMIRVADVRIENLRFSVTSGLAAEQVLVAIFENATTRAFEVAKLEIANLIAIYNTKVALFNAAMDAYRTKAQVYETVLRGRLAALEAFKVQMEGAKIAGEVNEQRTKVYEAQVKALMSDVELYRARLQGVQAQVDAARASMDGYRIDVQAYAEKIGAERIKIESYKAQVDGEAAKSSSNAQRANVFQTLVQAQSNQIANWRTTVDAEIAKLNADTNRYGAQLDGYRTQMQSQLGVVQAIAESKRVDIQAQTANNSSIIDANRAAIAISEQRLQSNLARATTAIKLYEVNLTKILQQRGLQNESLKSAGQMLATLVAGAMSAQHVSAGMSFGQSNQYGESKSLSNSLTEKIGS